MVRAVLETGAGVAGIEVIMERITDTLNQELIIIMRRALNGEIGTAEAVRLIKHAKRIAQARRLGVPVVELSDADLFAVSGL
jgi:hypothetical protein